MSNIGKGTAGKAVIFGADGYPIEADALPSLGYVPGLYYFGSMTANNNSTVNKTCIVNGTYVSPFLVTEDKTFDRVTFNVQAASTAGTSCRLGIYNMVNGLPTTVLVTLGTALSDGTGVKEITISQALTRGYYGLAIQIEANVTLVSNGSSSPRSPFIPVSANTATTGLMGYSYLNTSYSDGFDDLTGDTPDTYEATLPIMFLRST